MAPLHSLLWAAVPFLSFIRPSLQARGTLRVDDEHRGTIRTADVAGATAPPIPLVPTQSEPIAVEGAYLIAFEEGYRYNDGFLTKLSDELGIQASLRVDLTGEIFNGVSIQISSNRDIDGVSDVDDTTTEIATLDEVTPPELLPGGSPAHLMDDPAARLAKTQRLGQNYSQTEHLMAQIDQAHAAGYTGKGQKIAIIDSWIDYTHPALGGCLGEGCLVSFGREWLEEDDKNNPDPECKSHATSIAGVIAAQPGTSGPAGYRGGVAPGVQLGSYAIAGCAHGGNDEKLLQALDRASKMA
ncbi:hypothetical protein PG993_013133 [Apiospora rasikravindrae]|uniref:Peptidase S8/S53 domain-containing protein n=1 Tax=Apiospora rasikravindrae TaxID=990691 RepID=A0ABR1RWT6_9PEZI